MGPVNNIVKNFDTNHGLYRLDFHSAYCNTNDHDVIITEITEKFKVLDVIRGRYHRSFPNFSCNLLKQLLNIAELIVWLQEHCKKIKCTINIPDVLKQIMQTLLLYSLITVAIVLLLILWFDYSTNNLCITALIP